MAKVRSKHARCSVIGCVNEQRSLFLLPSSDNLKAQWVNFIFNERVKTIPDRVLYVCSQHFTDECFHNLGAYKEGFASRLLLHRGSVPTVRDSIGNEDSESTISLSNYLPTWSDVPCQTDPLDTCTVGTQVAFRSLDPCFRSAGVQATVSCKDSGVGTSTADGLCELSSFERPFKRSCLDEFEQGKDSLKASFSIADPQGLDCSVTSSEQSSASPNNINKYIVYESCIMELFAVCPVCTRACDARTKNQGPFLSVEQWCPHCEFYRQWNSQPVCGNKPAN